MTARKTNALCACTRPAVARFGSANVCAMCLAIDKKRSLIEQRRDARKQRLAAIQERETHGWMGQFDRKLTAWLVKNDPNWTGKWKTCPIGTEE